MPYTLHSRGNRAGFTMIELLTVMGIIIILLSILLPVVARVRQKGYYTDTLAQITRISTACHDYYQDFNAYPGPLPEAMLYGYQGQFAPVAPNTSNITTVNGANIPILTSTQNMTLGLLGGLKPSTTSANQFVFDPTLILVGPQSLNPASPRQYSAYFDPKPHELPDNGAGVYMSVACTYTQPLGTTPPVPMGLLIPELNDHFPTPAEAVGGHPIIYMRARVGGLYSVDGSNGVPSTTLTSQYYSMEMAPYGFLFPGPADPNSGMTIYGANTGFFNNPTLLDGYTPRGKDAFILISAGYDGLFGTSDDIIYPPN